MRVIFIFRKMFHSRVIQTVKFLRNETLSLCESFNIFKDLENSSVSSGLQRRSEFLEKQ